MNKRVAGFTLVELIISVVLFTIVIVFGMSFFTMGNRPFIRAKKAMFATAVGTGIMEQTRTYTFGNIPSYSSGTVTDPKSGIVFSYYQDSVQLSSAGVPYKIIGVTVTWPQQHTNVDFVTQISSTVL